jgi:nitrate reductase NapAB chaperone NapD
MPIAGLTLTLHDDDGLAGEALAAMRARPEIELGERQERWIPVVIEEATSRGSRDLHRWIEDLPGVAYADVVYVSFEEEEESKEQDKSTSEARGADQQSQASRLATR